MDGFKEKNEKIHIRRKYVLSAFIEKYPNLDEKDANQIRRYLKAEEYRYIGNWIKIFFCKINFKQKINFILESNSFLYSIKNKLSFLFMGRG